MFAWKVLSRVDKEVMDEYRQRNPDRQEDVNTLRGQLVLIYAELEGVRGGKHVARNGEECVLYQNVSNTSPSLI